MTQQQIYPKKKHTARNVFLIVAAVVVAFCGFASIVFASQVGDDKTKSPVFVTPSDSAPVKGLPPKTVKDAKPTGINEGTWIVGTDVKAGKYATAGALDSMVPLCYWDIRTGSEDGTIKTQGLKDKATAKGYVTLKTGQYFTTSGCKTWTPVK